jgi:hypothetical protein
MHLVRSLYRLLAGALCGAQLFFAAVAAQKAFPAEVAALPRGDPLRARAAELVGAMLAPLDSATLAGGALLVLLAVLLARAAQSQPAARLALRGALPPLGAALCAAASALGTTPAIQALREAGRTGEPRFGMLHGLSSSLLLAEMVLLAFAALRPLEPRQG